MTAKARIMIEGKYMSLKRTALQGKNIQKIGKTENEIALKTVVAIGRKGKGRDLKKGPNQRIGS